jgi:hypothetical protein
MADPLNTCIPSHAPLYNGPFLRESGGTDRTSRLEETGLRPVENPSPEQCSELNSFYNTTLATIQQIRNPEGLSPLKGTPTRTEQYYRGSAEEQHLEEELEKARSSGNREEITQARGNLEQYWQKIVTEEYGKAPREEVRNLVYMTGTLYRKDPRDPMTLHKLETLEKRARELNDERSLQGIQKIMDGVPLGNSDTGSNIARIARKHARGHGGRCYEYVKDDLEKTGIYLTGRHAYMAADQLADSDKVRELKDYPRENLHDLPAGAIIVWDKCKKGHGYKKHPSGHTSISLGDGREASDKIRKQMTGYGPRFRVFVPSDM